MEKQLTSKQKELVELNHKLIYKFAIKKDISIEEYYDILAIGLCKAAIAYDENKGKFSTLAFKCMNNELCSYFNHIKTQHVIPEALIFSYDAPINDTGDCLLDVFPTKYSIQDTVMNNIMIGKFKNSLDKNEENIVKLLISGVTQSEIARCLNCSRQNINRYIAKIRKKWNQIVES